MQTQAKPPVSLTVEQRRILDHDAGPLRIAAGAGTGKTGTLQLAIVDRIEDGASPGEILCLTFTVEATKEMRRRVMAALSDREGIDPDELTVQTYHAFAASIVREHAPLIGLDVDAALLDRARQWQLTLESLDRCTFSELEVGWLPTFVGKVLALHEEMLRHVVTPDQVRAWCSAQPAQDPVPRYRAEAVEAVEHYRALKLERGALDFGDQIALAVDVLRTRPDVLRRLRSRFRFVYLDEYQDTDVAQRELVKLVAADAKVVCAVGDVDQGIFGWRGATIHNMFAFGDDFAGARFETLSTNFRSGKRILDLANALIDVWDRPGDEERKPLVPADDAPKADIEAFVLPHQLDEAEEIASRIAAAGAPWSQYAVLARTRGDFDPIYRALVAKGVPVEVDTLGGFWTRPEILDVVSWLRVLDDPGDNLALGRLLIGPAFRLGRRDLFFLADHAKDENYRMRRGDLDLLPYRLADSIVAEQDIPELSDDARERITRFVATWRELAGIATRVSLADLVGEVARVSGLAAELAASPNPEAEIALRHVAKLRDIAQGYQPVAGSLDLGGFVEYLDSMDEAEQDEDELRATEDNAVRLLTLHRAKGLEWDVVFVPSLVKGHIPHPGRGANNPAERWERLPFELRGDREFLPPPPTMKAQLDELRDQEERRLFHVGVTRARRRLVLSRAWYYRDNIGAKQPSPFLNEALATGLVAVRTVDCPPENPYPLGVEQQHDGTAQFEPPPFDPAAIERLEGDLKRLRELEAKPAPPASEWGMPSTLSVTAFLTFVRDPDEFVRRYVRRVPSPPTPAAKLGTELHRRIELHTRGVTAAGGLTEDAQEPYDLDQSERSGDAASVSVEQMWGNFQRSRFADIQPLMTEQPFTLYLGHDVSVAGRIDAIYPGEHGEWEIVDFKTGKSDPDPMQLALYARAVREIWKQSATCKWFLLRNGREVDAPPIAEFDRVLEAAARRIRTLAPPTP